MSALRILDLEVLDVRFPTSDELDGSDAVHTDPDYSAAYVVLRTDAPGLEGHGLTFTIGRGNELCVAALHALAPLVVGRRLDEITRDFAGFWRALTNDSQLRWVGPEKGVVHLATAALVNAVWDLWAKSRKQPLWRLVADLTPEQFVALIDFRYITDALTPQQALEILRAGERGKAARIAELERAAIPPTRPRPAGSATPTRRSRACAARASPTAGTTSRSRSAPTCADDMRRAAARARGDRARSAS